MKAGDLTSLTQNRITKNISDEPRDIEVFQKWTFPSVYAFIPRLRIYNLPHIYLCITRFFYVFAYKTDVKVTRFPHTRIIIQLCLNTFIKQLSGPRDERSMLMQNIGNKGISFSHTRE